MNRSASRHLPVRPWFAVAGALTFALCVTSALGKNHTKPHHERQYSALAKVPVKAQARLNPLENDSHAVAAGRKLFSDHCARCHGSEAEGGKKAPGLRSEKVRAATPGTLFWILSNGVVRHGMPDWSRLPAPERWQIVRFLKSLPPATGAESGKIRGHTD